MRRRIPTVVAAIREEECVGWLRGLAAPDEAAQTEFVFAPLTF
jgi:hypothetical protein